MRDMRILYLVKCALLAQLRHSRVVLNLKVCTENAKRFINKNNYKTYEDESIN